MRDYKAFFYINDLPQKTVAEYLGVTKGYVSQLVSGKNELSPLNYDKLVNNPYGWDVTMLTEPETEERGKTEPKLVADHIPKLSDVEILLRDMLAEKEAKIDVLQDRINELIEENARLRTLIEGGAKKGIA